MKALYRERFLRSFGIMDESGLERIRRTTVAIGGLGLGGSIFINLVRLGVEKFHIADPDTYERTNVNRQRLAKESTVGQRKDDALVKEARDINPDIQVTFFRDGVNSSNVGEFLTGVDWVVDVVDVFALNEKLTLNEEAARRGLPVVSCGALGFAASVVVFDRSTPTFAQLTEMDSADAYEPNMRKFVRFICPELPFYMKDQVEKAIRREGHIPFVVPGVEIAAAFAVSEIAKEILGLGEKIRAPRGIHIDPVFAKIELYEVGGRRLRRTA